MKFKRSSGILLHPTSLSGPYGIGDIGPQAVDWLQFLAEAGCGLWQVLPLGPTGYGDSPYQCFSAFAGNPYLVSPQLLLEDGLLHKNDLVEDPGFPDERVDYGAVIYWKLSLLDRAYNQFKRKTSQEFMDAYDQFISEQAFWIDDFALFMALKEAHGGAPWTTWEADLRDRQPAAIVAARQKYSVAIERQLFRQFVFSRQWQALKNRAAEMSIRIIGDIPIFVAHDSADVWANPELFFLDKKGQPSVVAGVPPDYFSRTGQLWGNPLYNWEIHKQSGYRWWIERIRAVLSLVDIVRLDHFRGFAGYWEVPGDATTAIYGRWVKGPGTHFFHALRQVLGELPIIAEDLGVITPDVVEMRDTFELPGMKILQFAFAADSTDPFLPHNYVKNCVVYTGTHDNDTARGWYERVPEEEKDHYRRYMGRDGSNIAWDLIRGCWASVADMALAPMQDFLDLDNQARMNYPGNPSGNWTWRMPLEAASADLANRILVFNRLYSRENNPQEIEKTEDTTPENYPV